MAAPLIVPCARAVCVTGGSRKLNVWKGTTGHIEQCVSKGGRSVKAANWRQRASAFSCHATTPYTVILSPLRHMFINTRCSSPAKPVRGLLRLVCTNTSTRLQIKHPYGDTHNSSHLLLSTTAIPSKMSGNCKNGSAGSHSTQNPSLSCFDC